MSGAPAMRGPGVFLAQFMGEAPFDTLDSAARWMADAGYAGVQIPTWDARCIDLERAAESQTYADELIGRCREAGVEITELSTHLQGQLVAIILAVGGQRQVDAARVPGRDLDAPITGVGHPAGRVRQRVERRGVTHELREEDARAAHGAAAAHLAVSDFR